MLISRQKVKNIGAFRRKNRGDFTRRYRTLVLFTVTSVVGVLEGDGGKLGGRGVLPITVYK